MERNHRLIDGKIAKYMLPSIMMTMAMQLGNIVDTMLVGNLLGTKAMSAIMLCMPVMLIEQVVGFGLGTGAAIASSTLLGKRDKKGASDIFSTVFCLSVIFGMLFVLAAFFLCDPLARLLSGDDELTLMARDYLFVWMLGCPVIGIGQCLMNFMGVESIPKLSSAYIIVSNVINLVLDYIFLAFTPLGIPEHRRALCSNTATLRTSAHGTENSIILMRHRLLRLRQSRQSGKASRAAYRA